ncbi:Protein kinase C [Nymphon striatum]|nr:Protein kinase C [Nymphon striatum]
MTGFTGNLKLKICEAQELKPTEFATRHNVVGKIDPYVSIDIDDIHINQSTTKQKTFKPVWNEHFVANVNNATNLSLTVFHDAAIPPDIFVANCSVSFEELAGRDNGLSDIWRMQGTPVVPLMLQLVLRQLYACVDYIYVIHVSKSSQLSCYPLSYMHGEIRSFLIMDFDGIWSINLTCLLCIHRLNEEADMLLSFQRLCRPPAALSFKDKYRNFSSVRQISADDAHLIYTSKLIMAGKMSWGRFHNTKAVKWDKTQLSSFKHKKNEALTVLKTTIVKLDSTQSKMAAIELCRLGDLNETRRGVNGRKLVNVSTFVYRSQRIDMIKDVYEYKRDTHFSARLKPPETKYKERITRTCDDECFSVQSKIDLEPGGKIHVVVELQYTASGSNDSSASLSWARSKMDATSKPKPKPKPKTKNKVGERGFSLKTLDQRNQHRSEETGGQCWDQAGPCPARLVRCTVSGLLRIDSPNSIQLFFNFMQPPPPPPPPGKCAFDIRKLRKFSDGVSSSTNQHPRGRGYERRKIISNCLSIQIDSAKCPLFREISDCQSLACDAVRWFKTSSKVIVVATATNSPKVRRIQTSCWTGAAPLSQIGNGTPSPVEQCYRRSTHIPLTPPPSSLSLLLQRKSPLIDYSSNSGHGLLSLSCVVTCWQSYNNMENCPRSAKTDQLTHKIYEASMLIFKKVSCISCSSRFRLVEVMARQIIKVSASS